MSCNLLPIEQIRVMLAAGLDHSILDDSTRVAPADSYVAWPTPDGGVRVLSKCNVTEIGQMLLDANTDSVNRRYGDDLVPEVYTHARPRKRGWTPQAILKACASYEYNTSEVTGGDLSEALLMVAGLRRSMVDLIPSVDQCGVWTIDEDTDPREDN